MSQAIEVQVISKIINSNGDEEAVDTLMAFDPKLYFSAYLKEIEYIHSQKSNYDVIPSPFDFLAQFPEFSFVAVTEPLAYLVTKLRENRQQIMLIDMFNKIKDLGNGDVKDAWRYIGVKAEEAEALIERNPMNIVKQAEERAQQIKDYSKQKRIPTGFPEMDKVMYGGLSTVEELLVIIARTNSGKSWICTKMMESAQSNGFPVAYYSPEMQAAFLGTRFDTWREHFENNKIFKGEYSSEYESYIQHLKEQDTPAFVIEDKDFTDGVSVRTLEPFVKKHGIKLLIIDGISYMQDDQKASRDQEKYKNIAMGLFQLSKKYGCAVVLVMQANREVKNKDDKGENIPTLYNAEGSDQPARIATQAFGVRQIFDKHVLDIGLLKSRNANNTTPVFSYAWDINTGQVQYIPGDDSSSGPESFVPNLQAPNSIPSVSFGNIKPDSGDLSLLDDASGEDIVEF